MVKTVEVFAMTRNGYFVPALMGTFTGLVFFGVQVSLDAVNHMVRPHDPYTLCSVCRAEPDKWHFIILEKSFYVTLPPADLPPAAGKIMRETERFAAAKYSSVQGKSFEFVSAALKDLNNAWEESLRIAGNYYYHGLSLLRQSFAACRPFKT
jgi:hypothetical protein